MLSKTSALFALGLAGTTVAETVHGVVVFSRHGDRTTKWYGAQELTSLGAEQNFLVGSAYRERYLSADSSHRIQGISEDEYVPAQVWASAPDQGILLNTATAFLQGLYPPLLGLDPEVATSTLNNGTNSTSPLDGYQYVRLHGVQDNSPDTIWIKGDDACPAYKAASKTFEESETFHARDEATRDFYEGFYDKLSPGVYDLTRDDMTYANAYDIFDLVNVARIHNDSFTVDDADLRQLRTLADSAELGLNWNASQPARAIGAQTLAGAVLTQLNETVEGGRKFSLLAGSYDTFLAFFGLTGLLDVSDDFHGLPEYASTMAFELFTEGADDDDMQVRWLFRNGTAGNLTAFPLFGGDDETLAWPRFVEEMQDLAISDVGDWCAQCSAEEDFCAAYDSQSEASEESTDKKNGGGGGMSNAVAGVIGAVVALAVAGVAGAIAFVVLRRRKAAAAPTNEKGSVRSGSTDEAARV